MLRKDHEKIITRINKENRDRIAATKGKLGNLYDTVNFLDEQQVKQTKLINALVTLVGDIDELTADPAIKDLISEFWNKHVGA